MKKQFNIRMKLVLRRSFLKAPMQPRKASRLFYEHGFDVGTQHAVAPLNARTPIADRQAIDRSNKNETQH